MKKFLHLEKQMKNKSKKVCFDTSFLLVALQKFQVLKCGLHYGTSLKRFQNVNLSLTNFCFFDNYKRLYVVIFSLNYLIFNFKLALMFLSAISSQRGKFLFADVFPVNYYGSLLYMNNVNYIYGKWPTGLITNFKALYFFLLRVETKQKLTLKKRFVGGLRRIPTLVMIPDIYRNFWCYRESFRLRIPLISLNDGTLINKAIFYTFPGNCNTIYSLSFFSQLICAAIIGGYETEVRIFYGILRIKKLRLILLRRLIFLSKKK